MDDGGPDALRAGRDEALHAVSWHPAGPRSCYDITLLGEFQLLVPGGAVELPATCQRLVVLLALNGRCGRSRVAGTLWPQGSEERALANLRSAIWRVNRVAPCMVVTSGGPVGLGPGVHVDLHRFLDVAATLMRVPPSCTDWQVVTGAQGELLPEWSDEWLLAHRERLRQLRLHTLEAAAAALADLGRYGLALDAALAAVRADPLRESAHRAVIRVHLAEGNVVEARRAYLECRTLLRRELHVEPSVLTARMVAARPGPRPGVAPVPGRPPAHHAAAVTVR